MHIRKLATLILAAGLIPGTFSIAHAQDGAKQDMKDAGHDTRDAAVDTGHGVKQGTRKAYHATKRTTKKAAHKTAHGTKKAADKVSGKDKE